MKLSFAVLLAILIAAGAGRLPQASAQTPPASPEPVRPGGLPANYRWIIRKEVKLTPPDLLVGAQVSELRQTRGPQIGDWMVCLKTTKDNAVVYFPVFFEGQAILTYRRAIAIDDCQSANYSPLAMPAPAAKKPPAKRPPPKRN
jgi:hypothetical protein